MMSRVDIDLGISNSSTALLPTDQRITSYEADPESDKELMVLLYNFGRHLLISSSSDAGNAGFGVPANLQGIWNENYSPPWCVRPYTHQRAHASADIEPHRVQGEQIHCKH